MNNQLQDSYIRPDPEGRTGRISSCGSFDLVRTIEQRASASPDNIAVSFGSTQWTYGELVAAVDRLVVKLGQRFVGRTSRVAVCTPPDQHAPVALLAILKLGATYIPIGSDYPKARVKAIIDDVKPAMVLTTGTTAALFDDLNVVSEDVAKLSSLAESPPQDVPRAEPGADDDAYVFYTSGTTGEPKGIAVGYQALSFYIHAGIDAYGIAADDTMLSVAKYSFSISLLELLLPLVAGGRLMLLERDEVMVASELTSALQQATVAHIGPSLLRTTLDYIEEAPIEPASFDHMRHISAGGDVVPPELLERMKRVFRNADVCVIYGCTEIACMGCTYFAPRDQTVHRTFVGKPFAGMEVILIDEDGQPVERGDVGEVLFAGPGLLNSYVNKPDLLATKRVTIDGKTYFRTGDLGRLAPSGDLELLGRRDFQVKVRGLRIEPVEVETHLRRIPGVVDCVVAAVDGQQGEKRLVAYLVVDDQVPATVSVIRAALADHLPGYMIPSAFLTIDKLPLNRNLKVDRNALPDPSECGQLAAEELVAPRTQLEAKLADIWCAELHLEAVGVTSNFFDLGGDSLLAVSLCLVVSEAFDVALRPSAIYETSPTIEELARLIETKLRCSGGPESHHNGEQQERTPIDSPQPIMPPAARFLKERENIDQHRWNIAQMLESHTPIEPGLMEQAVGIVARRHDALDMRLTDGDSCWYSLTEEEAGTGIAGHVDFSALSDGELPLAISGLAEREHASLNLAHGPVLRVVTVDLGPDRSHRLLVLAHHLVVDGTSWPVLVRDLIWTYEQLVGHRTTSLVTATGSYRRWSEALSTMGADSSLLAGIDHWTDRPWGEVKRLPQNQGAFNSNQSARTIESKMTMEETDQLSALLPRGRSVTEILIASLARAVSRWSSSDWVLIDSLEDGRNLPNVETIFTQSVGFMGCYIPLLLHAGGDQSKGVAALRDDVWRGRQEGYAYDVLRYLAADPQVRTRVAALPRSQIIFNYGRATKNLLPDDSLFREAKESHGQTHEPMNPRDYVLGAVVDPIEGQLVLKLVYSENLHDETTVKGLLDNWISELRTLF